MSPRFIQDPDTGRRVAKISDPARLEARALGHTHYTGGPCKTCQSTLRYASTGQCVSCNRKATAKRNRTPKARAWRSEWARARKLTV